MGWHSPRQLGVGCSLALLLAARSRPPGPTHNAGSAAPVDIGSFSELNLTVGAGARVIEITSPEIVFDHQLEVRHARPALLIESAIGATLSGGNRTRLFFLHIGSALSLRGVNLIGGVASGTSSDPRLLGGAIFVSAGSELHLHSARVFDNRAADLGGAIYVMSSTITATDCTLTSNSATQGGAVTVEGNSSVTATDCTLSSNFADQDGAVYFANGNSAIISTDCTMTSNSAFWGGAVYYADADSTIISTNCTMTSNSAALGGVYYTNDYSTVTATDCTMTSNSADWGGVYFADGILHNHCD